MGVTHNAHRVADQYTGHAQSIDQRLSNAADRIAERLLALAYVFSSGRPGPNVVTDSLRGGLEVRSGTGPTRYVGTDRPYGYRLEFGFVGADSLGRVYHQPPYPWLGPAIKKVRRETREIIAKEMNP